MNENIQFLKDLQTEMNSQENDGQANPRYWSIMDYKWIPTSMDHAEHVMLFDSEDCEDFDIEGYVEHVKERAAEGEFTEEEVEELEHEIEYGSPHDIYIWIEEYDDSKRFYPIYQMQESFIVYNSVFFTKQEAKEHLKANSHHYTKDAHTFAMTAWRAPKMERLIKVLETFDWDSVAT